MGLKQLSVYQVTSSRIKRRWSRQAPTYRPLKPSRTVGQPSVIKYLGKMEVPEVDFHRLCCMLIYQN